MTSLGLSILFLSTSLRLRSVAEPYGIVVPGVKQVEAWVRNDPVEAEKLIETVERLFSRLRALLTMFQNEWREDTVRQQALPSIFWLCDQKTRHFEAGIPTLETLLGWPISPPVGLEKSTGMGVDLFRRIENFQRWQNDPGMLAANKDMHIDIFSTVSDPRALFVGYLLYVLEAVYTVYMHYWQLPASWWSPLAQGWLIEAFEEALIEKYLSDTAYDKSMDAMMRLFKQGTEGGLNWISQEQINRVAAVFSPTSFK